MRAIGPGVGHVGGSSWLHRLNPIVKLAWLAAAIAVALATYHPLPLLAMGLIGFAACASAGIGRPVARVLLIFGPLTASMLVIQTLAPAACRAACTPAAVIGPLDLYAEGTLRGLSLASRIVAVEVVALGTLMTTRPSDLFAALARLRVPYLLNFMLSMTLQLVPILQREASIVLSAQRARGMRSTGFGSIVPSLVPVFVGSFERVHQLSISLESRAFGSTTRPTSYRRIDFRPTDAVLAFSGLAAGVVGVVAGLTVWNADRGSTATFPSWIVIGLFLVAATVFIGVVLAGIRTLVRA
jgi:energy-coupling factor transport system permease protein